MKLRDAVSIAGAACALSAPNAAFAWGDDGHRIVGLIAESYLDPAVRAQVDAMLAGDATGLTPSKAIPDEATWADKFRDSDRFSTNVHYNQTEHWHFVDIELSGPDLDAACNHHPAVPTGTFASVANPIDCVVDKIDQFSAELANPRIAPDERREALQFLLHFVGDLHQPLHASDDHDSGGNGKKTHGTGASSNLHSSWDTPFVTALGSDDAAIAAALVATITPAQVAQWSSGTPSDWAMESFQLAKTEAYGKLPAPNADGSYTLDAAYVTNAHGVVSQQLSKAGVRLAWVLNRALAGGTTPPPQPAPQQLLGNTGFEQGSNSPAPWVASPGVIAGAAGEAPHSGQWTAWLCGYGSTHTDTLKQTVSIPSSVSSATLTFWLRVATEEVSTTTAHDKLTVQLLDASGHVLKTLATFSNLDAGADYQKITLDAGVAIGKTVTLKFTGKEDKAKATSFVIDDVTLEVR